MAAPLNYFTGPEWAPLPQYQLTPTGKPVDPAASPLAPNGNGMTLQPFPLNGQAGGRGPLGTPLFPGRTNPAQQQPQMPMQQPMGGFGGFGGMNDSGPSFAGAPDGYDPSNPGMYSAGLGQVIGDLATGTGVLGVGGMMAQGALNAAFPNTVPAPTGPFDPFAAFGQITGLGGRGNSTPASFTVGRGGPGPAMPPVPPQPEVLTSLLGDPGEGQGSAPGMGASDANFDGISFGDLGDFGYSGGFGVF